MYQLAPVQYAASMSSSSMGFSPLQMIGRENRSTSVLDKLRYNTLMRYKKYYICIIMNTKEEVVKSVS